MCSSDLMHMFQQNGYKNKEHLHWLKKKFRLQWILYFGLALGIVTCVFPYLALEIFEYLELSRRLMAGGYAKNTPAALIYKATWPEEEAYICTVETLAQVAEEHGIIKTALVLVGDVITHGNYQKSRLYAADFSTEFRQAKSSVRQTEENREEQRED